MIIVSNTSPLTNLAAIGLFDVLRTLYGVVNISTAVWDELTAGGERWPGANEVAASDWITQHPRLSSALVRTFRRTLDDGESESIALALELKADLILLDDLEAREAAEAVGLNVIGVLGVLLEARARGLIQTLRPSLDALRHEAGFYISQKVYKHVLELAGE